MRARSKIIAQDCDIAVVVMAALRRVESIGGGIDYFRKQTAEQVIEQAGAMLSCGL